MITILTDVPECSLSELLSAEAERAVLELKSMEVKSSRAKEGAIASRCRTGQTDMVANNLTLGFEIKRAHRVIRHHLVYNR